MSEFIDNQSKKQEVLKGLIKRLHEGQTVDEVKAEFAKHFEHVSPTEISTLEAALIREGMPVEEIQSLCDVHAEVFKGSIEEIHAPREEHQIPGHPVGTFIKENRAIEALIDKKLLPVLSAYEFEESQANKNALQNILNQLRQIDIHYARKENLLFPIMEKHDITAPPKVMWGVDDEVRQELKGIALQLEADENINYIIDAMHETVHKIKEMIFKEENILFPMVIDTFSEEEWFEVLEGSDEFGYIIETPQKIWQPNMGKETKPLNQPFGAPDSDNKLIKFDAGVLTPEEVNAIMNTLPLDVTFVDANGLVKYFSQGEERIFPRAKTIIGREVSNCHPPASVHIVEQIVEDLKSGRKSHEDFWIKMGEQFVYIRYYAVRNSEGTYLGVLEVTQNIKPIMALEGEKRLMTD
jgi:hypothetical protein